MEKWYPSKVNVGPEGTKSTYEFMKTIYGPHENLTYAEFGIYLADTVKNVGNMFPNSTLYLFDFKENIENAKSKLKDLPNRIFYHDNSQKYNDSYNWSLAKLIEQNRSKPIFDCCFLDGAHTFAIDALNFFLCDRLLRVGGYIDFDDYDWTLRGSSLDPQKIPEISYQYTDEQINTKQVAMIVENLVRPDPRFKEIVKNKIFKKVA